jgi:hypothetical protein
MDKRLIGLGVLIVIVWLDAMIANNHLISTRYQLTQKEADLKKANGFHEYVHDIATYLPKPPTKPVSQAAFEMFVKFRTAILLADDQAYECRRKRNEELHRKFTEEYNKNPKY